MHPNGAFEWQSTAEMLEFVSERAFAHIFSVGAEGAAVVHAPLLVRDQNTIQFHVARRNRIADQLAGARVLLSLADTDAYQSANWYVSDNQVPTWHYQAVEIEGVTRQLNERELVEHLDLLSETMERRFSPERPWTRAKMSPGKFEAMCKAIVGFEIELAAIRGTRKFNQHKSAEDLAANIAGQSGAGREDIADAIREMTARK